MILRNRSIAALLGAETISSLGTQMTWLALPWFVLVTTGSPSRMGIVFAAEVAPMAVLGIASGGVVQRLGARRSMLVSDFARAPLIALVPVLHRAGVLSFGLIVALVALASLFTVPYFSSQRLILPEVLGDDEQAVTQANSLFEATRVTAFVGPAVAGVLIGAIGRRTSSGSTPAPTSSPSRSSRGSFPNELRRRRRRRRKACSRESVISSATGCSPRLR